MDTYRFKRQNIIVLNKTALIPIWVYFCNKIVKDKQYGHVFNYFLQSILYSIRIKEKVKRCVIRIDYLCISVAG